MNKSDLVTLVTILGINFQDITNEDLTAIVETIIEYIKQELVNGNRIEIRGFGSFSLRKRKYPYKNQYYNTVYYRMARKVKYRLEQGKG